MNKNLILSLALLATTCNGSEPAVEIRTSYIPHAAYAIYEGDTDILGGLLVPGDSRFVTLYTFDGKSLATVEHHHNSVMVNNLLDPNAPTPQPVSYQIEYWAGIPVDTALKTGADIIKGQPGEFIVFYDKHGNRIQSYRYDTETQEITFSYQPEHTVKLSELKTATNFPLDISIVQPALRPLF